MTITAVPVAASVAGQLEAAATFLRETPGIRVSRFAEAVIHYFCDTTEQVDEIAAVLGKQAQWDGHHYSVKVKFGPEVTYSAVHICTGHCRLGGDTPGTAA